MISVIEVIVERCSHNRRIKHARMIEAEPHILRWIGHDGNVVYGDAITEMMLELARLGHNFTTKTKTEETSILDFTQEEL